MKGVIIMNYEKIKEFSPGAYDFILNALENGAEDGRYDFDDGVFVGVSTYTTKYRADACFEAHKKYIDVQVMLDGSEIIATEHIDKMHRFDCIQPFGDGDLELYAKNNDCVDNVLNKGDFLVLYPEDGHMPGVCIAEPKQVKKAVIKVPVK